MAKTSALTEIRRKELIDNFAEVSNEQLCEQMKAHFESHPTLPGEKTIKERVNNISDESISADERKELLEAYAQTRIREVSIGNKYVDADIASGLKRSPVDEFQQKDGQTVYVDRVDVVMYNTPEGVEVFAEETDTNRYSRHIGNLPENFVTNNPMNVDKCRAELQITDYSNGNMKNISLAIVADSDIMSHDVIDEEFEFGDAVRSISEDDSLDNQADPGSILEDDPGINISEDEFLRLTAEDLDFKPIEPGMDIPFE